MKTTVLALAVAFGTLGLLLVLRGGVDLRPHSEQGGVTVKATQRLAPDAVVATAPGAPPAMPKPAAAAKPSRQSALMAEVSRARNYKEIHDRLNAKADLTPEESYALAEILARCGKNIPKMAFNHRQPLGGEDRRKLFVDAISPKDPQRETRIAAFDEINHDPCAGLEGLQTKPAEVRALIAAAAAAGDPKARAAQVIYELWDQMAPDPKKPGPRTMSVSDAQLDTLRGVFASDDPQAVLTASRALLMNIANLSVRVGPGESTLDNGAFHFAAQFLACDLGNPCGRDSPDVMQSCAISGNCAASDYREHIYFYNLSPASVQTMQLYYEQLQRAREGDWSYFTFFRGQSPRAALQPPPKK